MTTTKRKALVAPHFHRRVRPRRDSHESDSSPPSDSSSASTASVTRDERPQDQSEDRSSEDEPSNDDGDDTHERDDLTNDLGTVSFGALANAQEALRDESGPSESPSDSRKRPRTKAYQQLQEARATRRLSGNTSGDGQKGARTDKHAPPELTSKKAVTHKRHVVDVSRRLARDPRFESRSGPPPDSDRTRKNYAFLEDYREQEMKQLRESIRRTKDDIAKATLKRELLSMESRKQTQARKDKQQEILQGHRTREKELAKRGKKPFYLKKADQKKLVLIDRYHELYDKSNNNRRKEQQPTTTNATHHVHDGERVVHPPEKTMIDNVSGGGHHQKIQVDRQLDRIMERKRRKNAAKERRLMPFERRRRK